MSLFGSILSRIFNHPAAAAPGAAAAPPGTATTDGAPPSVQAPAGSPASSPAAAPGATPGTPAAPVDVGAVLGDLAAKHPEKLNWQQSIVDLMKLLDLDSSLSARRELAQELKYSGDTVDTAKMNMWLHREVMNKLAANGGKVPPELKD